MKKVTLVIVTPCTISIFVFFFFKRHLFKEFWVFYRVCQKKLKAFEQKSQTKETKKWKKIASSSLFGIKESTRKKSELFWDGLYHSVWKSPKMSHFWISRPKAYFSNIWILVSKSNVKWDFLSDFQTLCTPIYLMRLFCVQFNWSFWLFTRL